MLGVPVMSKPTFIHTERDIGDWWKDKAMESLLEAGVGKRTGWLSRLVLHEGVPAVTVIVDGGGVKEATSIPTMMQIQLLTLL